MKQREAQMIFLSSLRTQNISPEMLADYLNKSFYEEKEGLPEDYFYSFMREAIKKTMTITTDLLDEDIEETMEEIKALIKEKRLGSNIDMYV